MNLYRNIMVFRVIRYGLLVLLVVAGILLLTRNRQSNVPFETVSGKVQESITSDHMTKEQVRFLKKYYGLNAEDYEGVLIYIPGTNMYANEVLLIRLSDISQTESVRSAIEERIDTQHNIFAGYAPEQTALLEQSVVDVRGNYILYVTDDDADRIDEVFRSAL